MDTYSLCALWLVIIGCCCHIFVLLLGFWNTWIRCILEYSQVKLLRDAEVVHAVPPKHCGQDSLCKLQKRQTGETFFIFQKVTFVHDEQKDEFHEIKYPDKELLSYYLNSAGVTSKKQRAALDIKYGRNEFDIPTPDFWELFQEHATAPFFLFQICTVGLWCLDEYWKYSVFTLVMLIVFEVTMVQKRMQNMTIVRNMRQRPHAIWVFRYGTWKRIGSNYLHPGDYVSLVRLEGEVLVPCDMLLLDGSVVVNEALLTGESVPQIKEPLDSSRGNDRIEIRGRDKSSIIFGGTNIVVTKPGYRYRNFPPPPDNGARAFVYRTGFSTQQGGLLRTILFSTERVSVNNPEAFIFIAILCFFAMFASGYVLYWGLMDSTRNRFKLALNCIMIITSVVPPELPMELSLAVNTSLMKLMKNRVFCTEAFRIPFAGGVEFCCFDKTGTLTSDEFKVKGLAGLSHCSATAKKTERFPGYIEPFEFPTDSQLVVAGCNSLVTIPEMDGYPAKIVGDPLEKSGLNALHWKWDHRATNEPCFLSPPRGNRRVTCKIIHRFPFASSLKRMSCIIEVRDNSLHYRIVAKGAAEVIKKRLVKIPEGYDKTCKFFSKQGCRVLALGWKYPKGHRIKVSELRKMKRDDAESNLIFAGFLVLTCPLKETSKTTIKELRESSHAVMMITGDHMLTACAVAKDLEICTRPCVELVVSKGVFSWETLGFNEDEEAKLIPLTQMSRENSMVKFCRKYDLCITGKALKLLQEQVESKIIPREFLDRLIRFTKVFARTNPQQKEYIVKSLKDQNICTLMCGDGTNDVGALRQAHCGVALISMPDYRKKSHKQLIAEDKKRDDEERKRRGEEENMSKAQLQKRKWEEMIKKLELESGGLDDNKPVKLGDASIASPFTSKVAQIESVLHIIRQGRCTLVTTLQMYQILALNCLISAYSLSVLYLDGIKFGDSQMTISAIGTAALFLFVTRSEPREELSKQQPRDSIFTWYMAFSMTGQIITHIVIMVFAVSWSKPHTPTDEETRNPDGKFKPNVLNTVVFLISSVQIVGTFAANYIGEPFMQSLQANKGLWRVILLLSGIMFICASGVFPEVEYWMEIEDLPSPAFRNSLLTLMVMDLLVVVGWERICRHTFRKHPNPLIPLT